jgi:hypothetical protein
MDFDGLPPSVCGFSVQVTVYTVLHVFYFVYSGVWRRTWLITPGRDWMFSLPPESSPSTLSMILTNGLNAEYM